MIEDRLKLNNQGNISEEGIAWLTRQRRTASTIYELFGWLDKPEIRERNSERVVSQLNLLLDRPRNREKLTESEASLRERIPLLSHMGDKLVASMLIEITEDLVSPTD